MLRRHPSVPRPSRLAISDQRSEISRLYLATDAGLFRSRPHFEDQPRSFVDLPAVDLLKDDRRRGDARVLTVFITAGVGPGVHFRLTAQDRERTSEITQPHELAGQERFAIIRCDVDEAVRPKLMRSCDRGSIRSALAETIEGC